MVKAGGEGGFLEDALDRIAQFTEQQEDLKSRTTGALAYPAFLAVVASLVVSGMLIFFVPRFAEIFDRLRSQGELPAITDWLLLFSDTLKQWWFVILAILGIVLAYLQAYVKTDTGRRRADYLKLKIPLVGSVFQSLAVARFCRVLGTLIHNGVPILRSLDISRDASGNRILSEAIEKASENISSGESLATPLIQSGHFPRAVVEMISVAEEANTLDTVLIQISDGLEKRTERKLDLVVRLIEPIMLMILAGIILIVVIALLLPILKMSSAV
jgi:general secretion pathway protein F/type IV pilus assembly protein PilC